jgi:RimJ/RimL family protein N-acetyltransferase
MIQLDSFLLRPYRDTDAAAMSAAVRESTETIGKWMAWARPDFSDYDALVWFEQCRTARASGQAHEFGIFTHAGDFVGGCGLNQFSQPNRFCNLGYWVRQSQQGRGAATAATQALRQLAFTSLDLWRVEIVIAEGNEPSLGVARKVGATYECLARHRLQVHGKPSAAQVFSFTREPLT